MMRRFVLLAFLVTTSAFAQRTLTVDDFAAIRDVGSPHLSPDGKWVLYTVRQPSLTEDKSHTHLWMTSYDGTQSMQITFSDSSETTPQWSPDGKSIAFVSSRGSEDDNDQLWIMNRSGGEAEKITSFDGSVVDYDWAPDSKRMAVVVEDPDPLEPKKNGDGKKEKTKPPIVINRYRFKEDIAGYLTTVRQHLYLLDLGTRKSEILTPGNFSEYLPAFSPDGKSIAFVSNRDEDPDRTVNNDLWVIDARAGAAPRRITTYPGDDNDPDNDSRPAWSPDSTRIAYMQGDLWAASYYVIKKLAVVPAGGGDAVVLTANVDRNVRQPHWSSDGASIDYILEDDRVQRLERISAKGGTPQVVMSRPRAVLDFDSAAGHEVVLAADDAFPQELFTIDGRQLTHHNAELLSRVKLGNVSDTEFRSKDGTIIHGFVVTPPSYESGKRSPTILRIHGGPVSQFAHRFSFEWQLLAANGYVVVAANPRGSSGRGLQFSRAIFADWGNKDVQDVLAAVDDAVSRGLADPQRLGVGGWSYGGILTNYVIASDRRFKAATSGASASNILAGYGTDMYVRDYEAELGKPWEHPEVYQRLSYPFLHADRIKTPTLFLVGSSDFNVPLLNSEQMYQALRSLDVPTELVIYPGQHHGISKPTYVKDRYQRYLDWYAKYLK